MAITESGQDLDLLTPANFLSPIDPFHNRWKSWINQAYKEIVNERVDWESSTARALLTIHPRILVDQGNRPSAPPVGSSFQGQNTNTTFQVVNVYTLQGSWPGGNAEANIDLAGLNVSQGEKLVFNEVYDELLPNPLNLNVLRIKGWGRYYFGDFLNDFQDLIVNKGIYLRDPNVYDNNNMYPLEYVQYANWMFVEERKDVRSSPVFITESPDGYFDLWPRPEKPYLITFHYRRRVTPLLNAADQPTLVPLQFHEAIVWRAVMYYAEFDHQPAVFSKAARRHMYYKKMMERDNMPKISWTPSVY